MATWAEVVDFSQPLTARPTNAPEEAATPMRFAPVMLLDDNGERTSADMRWAFSKQARGRDYPDHIHARDDKLLTSRLWRPTPRPGAASSSSPASTKARKSRPTNRTASRRPATPKQSSGPSARKTAHVSPSPSSTATTTRPMAPSANSSCAQPKQTKASPASSPPIPTSACPPCWKRPTFPWLGETGAPLEDVIAALRTYEDNGAWDMRPQSKGSHVYNKCQGSLL